MSTPSCSRQSSLTVSPVALVCSVTTVSAAGSSVVEALAERAGEGGQLAGLGQLLVQALPDLVGPVAGLAGQHLAELGPVEVVPGPGRHPGMSPV